jgi:hypothetical protein
VRFLLTAIAFRSSRNALRAPAASGSPSRSSPVLMNNGLFPVFADPLHLIAI